MLNDAYKDQYEHAYLITRDSDLMLIMNLFRGQAAS
jgi:hypothetical protein